METQVCRVCTLDLPLSEYDFRRDNNKHRTECKVCRAEREQAKRYGITVVRLREVKEDAGNRCQACGIHADDVDHASFKHSPLVIDHDHSTGEVRGLLCSRCNNALGHLDDSIEKILKLKSYLEKTSNV